MGKNILFISQYFYPETFRGNDIAFHFAEKGHNVHVICGVPNYPKGSFFNGYGIFKKCHEVVNGVKITRLPIIPRGNNKIMLMLNYLSFWIVSCIYMLFHAISNKYDCIFIQQLSPVMMSASGILYKRIRKIPLYLWVLDIWPDSLSASGGINNKYIIAFFNLFVKSQYLHADTILVSSRSFSDNISKYGDYTNKIVYYPQWAEDVFSDKQGSCKDNKICGLVPDGFIVMFAGAIGEGHAFETNMQAALLTKNYPNIKWVIVGDGRKLAWVRTFISKNSLENTVFTLGRYPVEAMPSFFSKADIMLVSLTDLPLHRLYAPAKISAYMAASKPILTALNGEGADVIELADCGWCVPAGNANALSQKIVELSKMDKKILENKGANGHKYYKENFNKTQALRKLDDIMNL